MTNKTIAKIDKAIGLDEKILKEYLNNKDSHLACYQQAASRVCAKMIMNDIIVNSTKSEFLPIIRISMPKHFCKESKKAYTKSLLGIGNIMFHSEAYSIVHCALINRFENRETVLNRYVDIFLND